MLQQKVKRPKQGEAASPASPSTCPQPPRAPQPPAIEAGRSLRHRCPCPSRRGPPSPALANGSACLLPSPDSVWLDTMGCPTTQPTSSAPARGCSGTRAGSGPGGLSQHSWFGFGVRGAGSCPAVWLCREREPPHSFSRRIWPTPRPRMLLSGVPCVPEEGTLHREVWPCPSLNWDVLSSDVILPPGPEDGGTRAVPRCRSCRGPRPAGVTPAQS